MTNRLFSEKFSTHLKNILARAQAEAVFSAKEKNIDAAHSQQYSRTSRQKAVLTVENMLNAAQAETGSIAAEILNKNEHKKNHVKTKTLKTGQSIGKNAMDMEIMIGHFAAKSILKAVQISHEFGHFYVGTEHLLKGILLGAPEKFAQWMDKKGITMLEIEKNIEIVLESTSKFPDLTAIFSPKQNNVKEKQSQEILEYFGKELTSARIQKEIDPVVGREKEIERIINILCRRYKNNPLLLGEAGVGKTAIVEGLSKRISQGDVPFILANKKIYTIDLGLMVAGSMYRGEFEARLKESIESAEKASNTILFIDEIHNIMGAGSASGSLDAANMLKPALARGKLSIIGATTLEEYKKHIEQDSALERRLQPIIISEPTDEETKEVLLGIKKNYESFHNVLITDKAISAAVKLSSRYMTDKLQPDKSIDLIDEASARVKVQSSQTSIYKSAREQEENLKNILNQKQSAVSKEQYKEAIDLKQKEIKVRADYNNLLKKIKINKQSPSKVTEDDIIKIVSSLTKVPLGLINVDERKKLAYLEQSIKKTIIGQDIAIKKIANLIRRSRANVSDPNRPIASFMFLGPSGTGKTETAKALAQEFFNDAHCLARLDMSEFSESYSISKLIGSPAGYVGYRDSNKFTDIVRANPYSVVLLDEIEKAHTEVFNLLLQILENGQITDSTGRSVNFRNTIIIMTSNIGINEFNKAQEIGFSWPDKTSNIQTTEKDARERLKSYFKSEFLNRIDSTIYFNALTKHAYIEIVKQYATELNKRIAENNILINMSSKAREFIVINGFDKDLGARGIRKFFQENIESEIAKMILNDNLKTNTQITVDVKQGNLSFS